MLYPATLGKQQVRSCWQGVDIGSSGGSNRWWHAIVVDTHWSAARPRASPRDLLPISVHTPAVSRAAVALHGFIGTVLIASRDVLSNRRSGASWTKLCRTLETVSVDFTLCFCPLWRAVEAIAIVTWPALAGK